MIELHNAAPVYEKEIHHNEERHEKIFVMINTFRGTEYLHIRKYYQDFDEEWKPTKEGVAIPIDFDNTKALFEALVEILSISEVKDVLETHFKEVIDNDEPLLMANSDQFVEWDSNETLYAFSNGECDGGILTFPASHPKWSYAKLDDGGLVTEVAEKKPISEHATVGVYWWKKGSDYVKYAEQMIEKDIRTNGEFYVCPVFNEAIEDGKKVRIKEIDKDGMWGIGTPEDLNYFLEHYTGEI
mgnify:CR=1 FL=1